jgi:hypothetical protein
MPTIKSRRTHRPSTLKMSLIGKTKLIAHLMKIGQIKTFDGIDPETEEGEEAIKQYLLDKGYKEEETEEFSSCNYYAIPSNLIHNNNNEEISKLYGSLISSDKTKEIKVYTNKINKKKLPQNLILSLIIGFLGFILSSGNYYIGIIVLIIFGYLQDWREIESVIYYIKQE